MVLILIILLAALVFGIGTVLKLGVLALLLAALVAIIGGGWALGSGRRW